MAKKIDIFLPTNVKIVNHKQSKMFPKERLFTQLLNKQKRKWVYAPHCFRLNKTTYTPDFYLPEENLYIEIVGSRQAFHSNKKKIIKFKKLYPHIKFEIKRYYNKQKSFDSINKGYEDNLKLLKGTKDAIIRLKYINSPSKQNSIDILLQQQKEIITQNRLLKKSIY